MTKPSMIIRSTAVDSTLLQKFMEKRCHQKAFENTI